jgi:nucleoside-diphosphate-sugar epimerase
VAFATGAVHLMSDGTPWRPLVHVLDISNAFLAVLYAPGELVHNQAFNVGRTEENYRIREVAEMVREVVPGSEVTFAEGAGPDLRCYRVDCAKLATLPGVELRWTVRQGVEQLYAAFKEHGLDAADLGGWRFQRIARIGALLEAGRLGPDLRWQVA